MVWQWLPNGETYEDMSMRFDKIQERDGQTDGQTPLDGKKGCAYVQHLAVKTLANQELSHTSANYLHTAGEFST